MKKTGLIILLMSIYFLGNAQIKDSLDIANQQKQIDDIYKRMYKHGDEHRIGSIFLISGLVVNSLITLSVSGFNFGYNYKHAEIGWALGSSLMITGIVIQIDSHKYFNRMWYF